jgi:hypothetical protein
MVIGVLPLPPTVILPTDITVARHVAEQAALRVARWRRENH